MNTRSWLSNITDYMTFSEVRRSDREMDSEDQNSCKNLIVYSENKESRKKKNEMQISRAKTSCSSVLQMPQKFSCVDKSCRTDVHGFI